MYLSFNELCINENISCISSIEDSKKAICDFVYFLHSLKKNNLLKGLRTTEYLRNIKISSHYGIQDWLKDSSIKKEHRLFLINNLEKICMYFECNNLDSEFRINIDGIDYTSLGLTKAVEEEGNVLSIVTNDIFKKKEIEGTYLNLNPYEEKIKNVVNLSAEWEIKDIKIIENNRVFNRISSGQDLWEQREIIFPKLIFCESVKEQLYEDPEKQHIIAIMKRLDILQKYFETYESYDITAIGFLARSESSTVKSDPKLKEMRKFRKIDGSYDYFFEHISFTGKFDGGRIYFLPDNKNRCCHIGYIGRHLPTKKY